jgi:hypothetical protein
MIASRRAPRRSILDLWGLRFLSGAGPVLSAKQSVPTLHEQPAGSVFGKDENGTDIFRPYSRPNSFREVLIRSYPSPDI